MSRMAPEKKPKPISMAPGKTNPWSKAAPLAVVLLPFLFYFPLFSAKFFDLDDHENILENSLIHHLGPQALWKMLTTFHSFDWMPLTWFSFALNYQMGGDDLTIYHLTNVLLHALNSLWVYWLTLRILRFSRQPNSLPAPDRPAFETWVAFLSAALFGLHPIHVESVAWASERKDVLFGFFFLASLYAYLLYAEGQRRRRWVAYAICFLLFFFSLMSKSAAISLPLALLILDLWPLRRVTVTSWTKLLLEKLPFFAAAFLVGILSIHSHVNTAYTLSPEMTILKPLHALFFYIWKMAIPWGLSPTLYPMPNDMSGFRVETVLCGLAALGVSAALVIYRHRWPWALAAWLFYLITVAPNMGSLLVPGHEGMAAADRFTYLPCIGIFVPVAAGAAWWLRRSQASLSVLAAVLMLGLGLLTLSRVDLWKDSESLWRDGVRRYPDSAYFHYQFAIYELNARRYPEAMAEFKMVEGDPTYGAEGLGGEGIVDFNLGMYAQCIPLFQKCLEINSQLMDDRVYLWKALTTLGRYKEALEVILVAVQQDPDVGHLWNLVGTSYGNLNDTTNALAAFQKALSLDPDNSLYLFNLGLTYQMSGHLTDAIDDFEKAAQIDPKDAHIRLIWGEADLEAKRSGDSLRPLTEAWEMSHDPQAAGDLAKAYRAMGQMEESKQFEALAKATNRDFH